jgi:ubiquinol-cytochrome c reductase iron-sulfur subunit
MTEHGGRPASRPAAGENGAPPDDGQQQVTQPDEDGSGHAPKRVIGTPPPAMARRMLSGENSGGADGGSNGGQVAVRELPADPADPVRARKAERVVALCFLLSFVGSAAFIASYVIYPVHSLDAVLRSNIGLGLSMTVAFLGLAVGATIWVRQLMPQVELTEERKPLASSPADRAAFEQTFTEGAEASQFVKRPLVRRTLFLASGALAAPLVVLLRDLGPLPRKQLDHTAWKAGTRLVLLGSNAPIRAADFDSPGGIITVIPEGYADNLDELAKAVVIIIKFRPEELLPPTVMNWTVDGIVAYSKICTHVGCPAALYEHTTHHILCPCHQSTFDAQRGARVIFGPAPRPLPQLPITVDEQGYLIAQSDFHEPVGPSFWELG